MRSDKPIPQVKLGGGDPADNYLSDLTISSSWRSCRRRLLRHSLVSALNLAAAPNQISLISGNGATIYYDPSNPPLTPTWRTRSTRSAAGARSRRCRSRRSRVCLRSPRRRRPGIEGGQRCRPALARPAASRTIDAPFLGHILVAFCSGIVSNCMHSAAGEVVAAISLRHQVMGQEGKRGISCHAGCIVCSHARG